MKIQIYKLLLRENIGKESFENFNIKMILMLFSLKIAKSCLGLAVGNSDFHLSKG
jgi:hypothetical protein